MFTMSALHADASVLQREASEKKKATVDRMRERLDELKADHALILDAALAHIRHLAVRACAKRQSTVRIWHLTRICEAPLQLNVKQTTHWTGFWDKATRTHDASLWEEAGLKLMLEAINERIAPLVLIDVSDPSLSHQKVFECLIPEDENAGGTPQ